MSRIHDHHRVELEADGARLDAPNAGHEDGLPFIKLNTDSTLKGVVIFYPDQVRNDVPRPYPYAVVMQGANAAVLQVELLNPYNGIDATGCARHLIRDVQGQPLRRGIYVDAIYDIGRIEDVHFNPWWSMEPKLFQWQQENGEAFLIAIIRLGNVDAMSREFAREHSERLWKQLALVPQDAAPESGPAWQELAVVLGLAVVLVWRSSFPTVEGRRGFCLFDDAMISLRYAANLAHGQGLVWNPGERVEGFTNPLMVFLMTAAVGAAGTWYAPLVVQLLGIAILLATLALVAALVRRDLGRSDGAVLAATAAAAAFYPLAYWSIMGMETGLLTLLLLVAFLADARDPLGQEPRLRKLLVAASALALLTRPDATLFLGVLFAARWMRDIRRRFPPVAVEGAAAPAPLIQCEVVHAWPTASVRSPRKPRRPAPGPPVPRPPARASRRRATKPRSP